MFALNQEISGLVENDYHNTENNLINIIWIFISTWWNKDDRLKITTKRKFSINQIIAISGKINLFKRKMYLLDSQHQHEVREKCLELDYSK